MSVRFFSSASALWIALLAPTLCAAQATSEIPDIAQALLDAAYKTGEASEIAAVARAVKAVFPDYEGEITAQSEQQISALAPPPEISPDAQQPPVTGGLFALKPWHGKINASALLSSGNSDNTTAGVSFKIARNFGPLVHNITGFFDLGRSSGETNQKRWGGAYQVDYQLSDRTFFYGRTSYEEDEFSGFDYRLFAGAGLGHFFFQGEPFTWKVETGPGIRYSPIDVTRDVERELAVFSASEIDWLLSDTVRLEQDFNATWTSPTTTFQSTTSLTTQLSEKFSTALSFEYRYETAPPEGLENTDTTARASVAYGF